MDPSKPFSDSDLDDLDEIVRDAARAPSWDPQSLPVDVHARIGSVLLGKYRVEAVLGVGGMAVVYRATHRNGAVRAIKMLLPAYAANPEVCRRFRREGRCANAVQHPGVVSVIDDDVTEDGAAFLVLELLEGIPCDELCERNGGRVSPEAACAIGLQVLDVLAAAHAGGVVHRDIKPGNLFVVRLGTVKVLDFGIARLRESMVAHTSLVTETGYRLGTPAFMAPEQIAGAPEDLDGRADLWSLGASLYFLMGGGLPTRPARSLGLAVPELPPGLIEVVDRALEFDPARRWATANEMKAALEQAASRSFQAIPGQATLAPLVPELRSKSDAPPPARPTSGPPGELAPPSIASIASTESDLVTIPAMSRTNNSPAEKTAVSGGPVPEARRRAASPMWIVAAAVLLAVGGAVTARASFRSAAHDSVAAAPPPPTAPAAQPQEAPPPIDVPVSATAESAAFKRRAPSHLVLPAGVLPRSCAEAHATGTTTDATVRIDPDGNGPIRPFDVFCVDMGDGSGPPREYVTLTYSEVSGHPEANATRFTWQDGSCECPDLVRRFHRVRLDPTTMTIDPRDGTFATYNRPLTCEAQHPSHCGDHVELAWGSPGSCRAPGDTSGRASIDLRGTPFALASTVKFVPAGFGAAGEATIAANRKTATLTGGGQCGSLVPSDTAIPVVQRP
jgi:serine/threonine-protein kinase